MKKVLIANRGEIAVRVVRACRDAGLTSVAVYADGDAAALHVRLADSAYALNGVTGEDTYLCIDKLIAVAHSAGADALHPGYGFLSENADFAEAVIAAGLTWIGPTPAAIRLLGNKVTARELAVAVGAPLVPGSDGPVASADEVHAFAREHGLPVAIKAAFGGGGRGLKIAKRVEDIDDAFASAVREATLAFGRGECFVERFLERPRHVEAQIIADNHGHVVVAGTRDCSLQRRNQKLVEEAPAPFLSDDQRARIYASAKAICRKAGYTGAGTVEYLVAPDGAISFLEVNTRLQVEHTVTEATSGIDLVQEQFRIAAGQPLSMLDDPVPCGHAIEFRLNAEDPARGFLPFPGRIERFEAPTGLGVRIDSGVVTGSEVSPHFDSLLAKLIVTGNSRQQALARAKSALAELVIEGVPTVIPFHRAVLEEAAFVSSDALGVYTNWIETEFTQRLEASPLLACATSDARRLRFMVDIDGKACELGLPADLLALLTANTGSVQATARQSPTDSRPADMGEVLAPIGGNLVKWLVDDGASVVAGEALVVLEAMKMETSIVAPCAGTLRQAGVIAGAQITCGDILAHIN